MPVRVDSFLGDLFSLLKKPDVLILDEALSDTDEKRESAILSEIEKYFDQLQILFVTHRLSSFGL